VNGYLRLWLPARCCQPAVAGGVIYADLRSELSSHLALQALFTQSSPVGKATATSFPLSKHTGGGDAAPAFSGRGVYLQFTWEVGLPLSPVEFSSHRHFYKLSCSLIAGHTLPLPPSPARPGLFIYRSGKDSPPSLFALYCSYCLLLSFSFFPGWGSVCPGGYADLAQGCLWEYRVPLSSPYSLRLPKRSGRWCLAAWEPSWFLPLTSSRNRHVCLGLLDLGGFSTAPNTSAETAGCWLQTPTRLGCKVASGFDLFPSPSTVLPLPHLLIQPPASATTQWKARWPAVDFR
jgi:hypothetical protein